MPRAAQLLDSLVPGSGQLVYHGTHAQFDAIRPNSLGLIFVTPDRREAALFASAKGGRVLVYRMGPVRLFDAGLPADLESVDGTPEDRLWNSAYVENSHWIGQIKAAGFDGMIVSDGTHTARGATNYALFDADHLTPVAP